MRVSGKNFQSWAAFDLTLDGLTVVTGPSDVGKSALFRALKGVLRNELPADFVRDGQENPMEVSVETGGHKISARRKRKGSTTYVIDGKEFAKLAGGAPDELKDLKFGEVVIGDYDVDPIFGRQNSAQFLIDPLTYKPTEVNAILGAFGGTEKLEHGKKEANLRKTQKDAEARTIAGQMREAEERRAALESMLVIGKRLEEESVAQDVILLEMDIEWLNVAIACHQRIAPLRQIMDALVLPEVSGLDTLQKQVMHAEQAADAAAYAKWLTKPSAVLYSASVSWNDAKGIWGIIVALEEAVGAGRHLVSTDRLKTSLADAETTYADAFSCQETGKWLAIAAKTSRNATASGKIRSSADGIGIIFSEAVKLWNSISRLDVLDALLREITDSAEKLAGVEIELSAAQAELRKGLCPKCGGSMEHVCQ